MIKYWTQEITPFISAWRRFKRLQIEVQYDISYESSFGPPRSRQTSQLQKLPSTTGIQVRRKAIKTESLAGIGARGLGQVLPRILNLKTCPRVAPSSRCFAMSCKALDSLIYPNVRLS